MALTFILHILLRIISVKQFFHNLLSYYQRHTPHTHTPPIPIPHTYPCPTPLYNSQDYLEHFVRSNTLVGNHAAGSCRMGPVSEETSVVDNKCRLPWQLVYILILSA